MSEPIARITRDNLNLYIATASEEFPDEPEIVLPIQEATDLHACMGAIIGIFFYEDGSVRIPVGHLVQMHRLIGEAIDRKPPKPPLRPDLAAARDRFRDAAAAVGYSVQTMEQVAHLYRDLMPDGPKIPRESDFAEAIARLNKRVDEEIEAGLNKTTNDSGAAAEPEVPNTIFGPDNIKPAGSMKNRHMTPHEHDQPPGMKGGRR